jgi:uncharacterized protein YkwD
MTAVQWKSKLSIFAALWLAVMLFVVPAPSAEAFSISYQTFPSGTIGLARPQIGITIDEMEDPITPETYSMYVNGKQVTASYNSGSNTISYAPDYDLEAGAYNVKLLVQYPGYEALTKSWNFTVASNKIAELPTTYTNDQKSGLDAINDYRLIYGLAPLTMNTQLSVAADKHASYLNDNKVDGTKVSLHDENSSLPGYIGATLLDRAHYVGYLDGLAEDVSYTSGSLVEAIDSLFDAPYHRIPFLDPAIKELGVGREGNYTVLEFGKDLSAAPQLIVSPASGDAYVPTQFDGHEAPDPLRLHTSVAYPVGYPLMAAVSGEDVKSVSLLSAKLTDASGHDVTLLTNTPVTDDHLKAEVVLLPEKPLDYDATYTVSVRLTAALDGGGSQSFDKTWIFHTEPRQDLGKRKLHGYAAEYKTKMTAGTAINHTAAFSLDGTSYTLDNVTYPTNIKPYIVDGSSYLWIRDLAAALGAKVDWNDTNRAAIYTKDGRTVTFYTTKASYSVDGREYPADTPAKLIGGNTMIPVRLLSEALGAKVGYDNATRIVTIAY